jgi:membrane-associated phospholipid phosphatase
MATVNRLFMWDFAKWLMMGVPTRNIVRVSLLCALIVANATAQGGSSNGSQAQSTSFELGELYDPHPVVFAKKFAREEYRIWTSPFRRSSYQSHALTKYVLPFIAISGVLIGTDTRTADALPNTADQTKWSGRVSQLGAGYTLAGFSGLTAAVGQVIGDDHAKEAGLLALEALAHTQVIIFGVKQITNRSRPLETDQKGGFWKGGDSFPSGHAASSFAVASVFAYEYRDHVAVPIVAYSLASVISASRLSARRHWFSDIFVGGSTGFLLGRYVYKKHHDSGLPGSPVQRTDRWKPDVQIGGTGVALSWVF